MNIKKEPKNLIDVMFVNGKYQYDIKPNMIDVIPECEYIEIDYMGEDRYCVITMDTEKKLILSNIDRYINEFKIMVDSYIIKNGNIKSISDLVIKPISCDVGWIADILYAKIYKSDGSSCTLQCELID